MFLLAFWWNSSAPEPTWRCSVLYLLSTPGICIQWKLFAFKRNRNEQNAHVIIVHGWDKHRTKKIEKLYRLYSGRSRMGLRCVCFSFGARSCARVWHTGPASPKADLLAFLCALPCGRHVICYCSGRRVPRLTVYNFCSSSFGELSSRLPIFSVCIRTFSLRGTFCATE